MVRAERGTTFVAAIALLVGFTFVAPAAGAVETGTGDAGTDASVTAIPPCAATPEADAGYATVGLDDFCRPYVEEDVSDRCRLNDDDPKLVIVECQLSDQECIQVHWEVDVGPVSWEFESCNGDGSIIDR